MIDHLSPLILNALADEELTQHQLNSANEHLADCPPCASNALMQSLLKSVTASAGQRYSAPPELEKRLAKLIRQENSASASIRRTTVWFAWSGFAFGGWIAACALLALCVNVVMMQKTASREASDIAENSALAIEACDQHIATLAANAPPQVISSDRHTVKPWFQGKLPFSFNLPEDLPVGTTLDGANLAYVHDRPAAHLLYSIGKHRASVYLEQRLDAEPGKKLSMNQSGFHLILFSTGEINGVAVSDVDPSHLSDLVSRITQTQSK